jgi:hypothetical protein
MRALSQSSSHYYVDRPRLNSDCAFMDTKPFNESVKLGEVRRGLRVVFKV